MLVYLDNSATTKPCREACEAVAVMMRENFGNPSSFHHMGVKAYEAVEAARVSLANSLNCEKEAVTFTSGGTEANNLALFGAAQAKRRLGNRIVTTSVEHESVLEAAAQLEQDGFEVVYLRPDRFGRIAPEDIFDAVNSGTILVSMMLVNNEVGSILPVETARKAVRRAKAPALIHCDCVQAFGKLPVSLQRLGADLITVSAHKIHGPKGVGALIREKDVRLVPRSFGGEQEKRRRPGTESTPLIAGFGAAVDALPPLKAQENDVRGLRDYAVAALETLPGVRWNSAPDASPFVLNFSFPGYRSQTIIQKLSDEFGICISNGSACAKGKRSHVLTAMGLTGEMIGGALRVSFCRDNSREDVDALVCGLGHVLDTTVKAEK